MPSGDVSPTAVRDAPVPGLRVNVRGRLSFLGWAFVKVKRIPATGFNGSMDQNRRAFPPDELLYSSFVNIANKSTAYKCENKRSLPRYLPNGQCLALLRMLCFSGVYSLEEDRAGDMEAPWH